MKFILFGISCVVFNLSFSQLSLINYDIDSIPSIEPSETTCNVYQLNEDWLPNAFVQNATFACASIPNESKANIIRAVLLVRMTNTPDSIKNLAREMKQKRLNKTISKRKYKRFILTTLTPIIYADHCVAYTAAGCPSDPAPYLGWKQITTVQMPNQKLVWFSIRNLGGSCYGGIGKW